MPTVMDTLWPVAAVLASYLLGSLSFAVIVSRLMGLADPRSYGSQNPGATNVLRSGTKRAAVLTLLFDALKGALPVALVLALGAPHGLGPEVAALCGLAAFLGHLYPVFFGFAGGKGVATAAGVLLGLHPLLGLGVLGSWLLIAVFFRYSSLAALVAAVFAPVWFWLGGGLWWPAPLPAGLAVLLMAALLIWRHRENIRRLLAGTESKLGKSS